MASLINELKGLSWQTQAVIAISAMSISYIVLNIVLSILSSIFNLFRAVLPKKQKHQEPTPSLSAPPSQQPQHPSISLKTLNKMAQKNKKTGAADHHADSELFLTGLRGHTDAVTGVAFSADGKYLATACERTLRVYDLSNSDKTIAEGKIPFKFYDLPHRCQDVAFGATSTQNIGVLTRGTINAAGLCMTDISQKEAHFTKDLPGIFTGGKSAGLCLKGSTTSGAAGGVPVFLAASPGTEMRVFLALPSLTQLGKIDTGGFNNYSAAISSDGRFIAAATFASDVKIYESEFDRTGNCLGVHKVMDLKGHKKKITALDFSPDGRNAVTASEDGTLRIWNIAVRYKQQEDPKNIATEGLPGGKTSISKLAWGRGNHIAAVSGSDIYILSATTGKVVDAVYGAHTGDITDLAWAPVKLDGPQGSMYVLVSSGVDGRVRLWRAPWALY